MMRKFKRWLTGKYLPTYAKENLVALERENNRLKQKNEVLKAYCHGLETGLRRVKIINNISTNGDEKQ